MSYRRSYGLKKKKRRRSSKRKRRSHRRRKRSNSRRSLSMYARMYGRGRGFGKKYRKKRVKRQRHRFGNKQMGPGYAGQTSFQNEWAPYFGAKIPFVNASEWWYADPGSAGSLAKSGKPSNYQSPNMLYKWK